MRMHALTGAAQSGTGPSATVKALALLVHRDGHEQASAGSAAVNPDDWRSDALLAKLSWAPSAAHKFTATVDAFRAVHDRIYANKQGSSYPDGATQDSTTRRGRVSIDHQYSGAGPWFERLDSRLYLQDAKVEDRTLARYITGNQPYRRDIVTGYDNRSIGFATQASRHLGAGQLAYGAGAEHLDTRRPWQEDRTVLATGAHQFTSKNRMADTDTLKLNAFARADIALARWLSVTPGLRFDRRTLKPDGAGYAVAVPAAARELRKTEDSDFTPSLGLQVPLRPGLNAYLQASRGTRLPSAAELTGSYDSFSYTGAGNGYAVLGNPALRKETSTAFELGIRGGVARGLRLHAALFRTRYADFIEYAVQAPDPVNYPTVTFGLYRPENIGKVRTWGGEASADLDVGAWAPALAGTTLALASGIQHGKARNGNTGMEAELASTLPRKSSMVLGWDDPARRGGAAFAVVHVAAKQAAPDVMTNTTAARFAVPAATVMDLTAWWNIGSHAALTAGIYNLADKTYWDYATSRSLPAATNAASAADIQRQARPGRYAAVTFRLSY